MTATALGGCSERLLARWGPMLFGVLAAWGLFPGCAPAPGNRLDDPKVSAGQQPKAIALETRPRGRGGPHYYSIDALWRSSDGAILSKDISGALVLWPSLDGEQEPIPLGGEAARADVAPRPWGWMVAAVRRGGWGVDIYRVGSQGLTSNPVLATQAERVTLGIKGSAADVVVLDDGILVSAGGTLQWVEDGHEPTHLPHLRPPGIDRLIRTADGKVFCLSWIEQWSGVRVTLRELLRDDDGGAELVDAFAFVMAGDEIAPQQLALSEDGSTLAYLRQEEIVVRRRGDHPVEYFPYERVAPAPALGFVGPNLLAITQGHAQRTAKSHLLDLSSAKIYPRSSPTHGMNAPVDPKVTFPAVHGSNLRVLGYGPHLYVDHPVEAGGETAGFLGYRPLRPASVALAPDESKIAWGGLGRIEVEDEDGIVRQHVPTQGRLPVWMTFLDEDHLVVRWRRSDLSIVDLRTGTVGESLAFPATQTSRVESLRHGPNRMDLGIELPLQRLGHVTIHRGKDGWAFARLELVESKTQAETFGVDADGLWGYSGAQLHRYGAEGGEAAEAESMTPLLLRGSVQVLRANGLGLVRREQGQSARSWEAPVMVERFLPGPDDGELDYALLMTEDLSIVALDRKTWAQRWMGAWARQPGATIAVGKRFLVIADDSGGKVIDAQTGTILRRRCGGEFGRFETPLSVEVVAFSGICSE